ncbi:MAG: archaeoflavoprotein AfpA [Methermicoccaceae archaeon]
MKIAWGITGCGHNIMESFDVMKRMKEKYDIEVHVFLSKAGEQVAKYYKIHEGLKEQFDSFKVEKNSNSPFLAGWLQLGRYDFLLLLPCTSNTVAKLVAGISDTMLTNAAIMGVKAYVSCYVMPSDMKAGEMTTTLPDGSPFRIRIRKEDVENVEHLREMEGFYVFEEPEGVEEIIQEHLINKKEQQPVLPAD